MGLMAQERNNLKLASYQMSLKVEELMRQKQKE
jgi:hypothetical protein